MPDEYQERVALKEYVERILEEQCLRNKVQLEATERALLLATREMERRLGELNQLRSEVTSDRSQFVQRAIYEHHLITTNEWRESISQRVSVTETRIITWTSAIGLFFLIVNVAIALILRK